MPSLGADMDQGTVTEWKVQPGDVVHRGDIVAVVDTEKSDIDVEVFEDGVIGEILVPVGQTVPVGTVLATIEPAGAGHEPPRPVKHEPRVAGPRVRSPLVRRLAEQYGVDLTQVAGTGRGGAISRHDVELAAGIAGGEAAPTPGAAPAPGAEAAPAAPAVASGRRLRVSPRARRLAAEGGLDIAALAAGRDLVTGADVESVRAAAPPRPPSVTAARGPTEAEAGEGVLPVAGPVADRRKSMRQAIASLMERSNREIPHYHLMARIDVTKAMSWLEAQNAARPVTERLLPIALLIAATAKAARAVPSVNGSWLGGELVPAHSVDVGLVVSLRSGGLLVPVIAGADVLPLDTLMRRLQDLVTRARSGRLRASEVSSPSISVTSVGDQAVDVVHGVIYPPQVAMVGFGRIAPQAWVEGDLLGVRQVVYASLAGDHRASDGHDGGRFLTMVDRLLQAPEEL